MKIDIITPVRWHSEFVIAAAAEAQYDLRLITSTPKSRWQLDLNNHDYRLVPHITAILNSKTSLHFSRYAKDKSTRIFSHLAAWRARKDTDILYCWSSFAREAYLKKTHATAHKVLERSCPHILFQQDVLANAAEKLCQKYEPSSESDIERMLEEYETADTIIVPSTFSARTFYNRGFDTKKITIIPLQANYTPKNLSSPPRLRERSQEFIVAFVGGNFLRKGVNYLIDAWQALQLPNSKLRLKISRNELLKFPGYVNKIKNDPSIIIVEYQESIEAFYEESDLLVLPSIDEGFGMVAMEAVASGVPVIVSDNVGAAEQMHPAYSFVVPVCDPDAIGQKIYEIYSDIEKNNEMKTIAKASYRKYLQGQTSTTDKYLEFLCSLRT